MGPADEPRGLTPGQLRRMLDLALLSRRGGAATLQRCAWCEFDKTLRVVADSEVKRHRARTVGVEEQNSS